MVGRTLKIYGKDFSPNYWALLISGTPYNYNFSEVGDITGWVNEWGSIRITKDSQNYNATDGTLSLNLTTELISLFKQGFNISTINNLTVTSIKVE